MIWTYIFRFWLADYQAPNETCFDSQTDGSCKEIFIPDCVDRTVYCSQLPYPENANLTVLTQTDSKNLSQLGTSLMFSCPLENWYFNYSTPHNLTSYFYSNNIKNTTLTCNIYGWVTKMIFIYWTTDCFGRNLCECLTNHLINNSCWPANYVHSKFEVL